LLILGRIEGEERVFASHVAAMAHMQPLRQVARLEKGIVLIVWHGWGIFFLQ
jgi:hypothetical protein